jgi:hypothetical protein
VNQSFQFTGYTGPPDRGGGKDNSILELVSELHPDVERYDIYRGDDELGEVGIRVGFGLSGLGQAVAGTDGVKRIGVNRYDSLLNQDQLLYDFDGNGVNTSGDTGQGNDEVLSATGDSGSPIFINGLIAGIAVIGTRLGDGLAYGQNGLDMRVSTKADWIADIIDVAGLPTVTNVTISGSGSAHAPYSFNDPLVNADGSGKQLQTVPVGGADSVSIAFSEHVINLSASSLVLKGLRTGVVAQLASNGFSYNVGTHVATWKFSPTLAADQWVLSLADTVTDVKNNALDGDWINPGKLYSTPPTYFTHASISTFPSGDNDAGGDFNFLFTTLPGDATLDNHVTSNDQSIVLVNFNAYDLEFDDGEFDGKNVTAGDLPRVTNADYSLFSINYNKNLQLVWLADVDLDGDVDGTDYLTIQQHLGMTGAARSDGDVDLDGDVDANDVSLHQSHFGMETVIVI